MNRFRSFIEIRVFGVCTYLGEKLGIPSSWIRLSFIYTSFITFGSPVLIYLIFAFLLRLRNLFRKKQRTIWDF